MSKNMKFLRNGALLLAVLAMVLGQCFGMLGGVVAKADEPEPAPTVDVDVTAIDWKTPPASQLLVGKTTSVTFTLTLSASDAVEETSVKANTLFDVYAAEDKDKAYGKTVATTDAEEVDVNIPKMAKGATAKVDVTLTITAGTAADAATLLAANEDVSNQTMSAISRGTVISTVKTVKILEEPAGVPDSGVGEVAALMAVVYNDVTGASAKAGTAVLGQEILGVNIYAVTADKGLNKEYAASSVKVENLTTKKDVATGLSFAAGVLEWGATVADAANFKVGLNTLKITSDAFSVQVNVNVAAAKPVLTLTAKNCAVNAADNFQNFGNATEDSQKVELVASVADIDSVYTFKYTTQTTDTTLKPEGTVVFKDNGTIIGSVPLGGVQDRIPATSNHEAKTDVTAGQASFYYIAGKGDHVYTAEFAPANDAAKVMTTATGAVDKVTFAAPVTNTVTLTLDPTSIIKGQPVKVTLSFDKAAPGAGTASFALMRGENVEQIVRFDLNGTDKTYTKTLYLTASGQYTIKSAADGEADKVAFAMDNDVAFTGKSTEATGKSFNLDVKFPTVNSEDQKTITVANSATVTTLTADKTAVKKGEQIVFTASVAAGATAVAEGQVQFFEVVDGKISETPVGTENIDTTKKTATLTYTADNASVVGMVAKYVPVADSYKYTASQSAPVAIAVEAPKGTLKVECTTPATTATGDAEFTLSILDATGAVDTDSYFGQVTKVMVNVDDYTDAIDPTTVYVYGGKATFKLNVTDLDAGAQKITVTVADDVYGTLTATGTFTVVEASNLIETVLVITDDDEPNADLTVFADVFDSVTVSIMDTGKTGNYEDATGKIALYIGGVKVAEESVSDGEATFSYPASFVGGTDLQITAKYTGDKKYAASEALSPTKFTVAKEELPFSATAVDNVVTIKFLTGMSEELTEMKGMGLKIDGSLQVVVDEIVVGEIALADIKDTTVLTVSNPAFVGEKAAKVVLTGSSSFKDASQDVTITFPASSGWVEAAAGVWNYYKDGEMVKGEWLKAGSWFYMNDQGVMLKGWQKLQWNGKSEWFYFKPASPNSGAMLTGWQQIGGKWYFMNGSGIMQTGWIKVGAYWYYMNTSGAMLTGWQQIGGNWYYLDANGRMATSGTIDGWNIAPNGIATKA